MQSCTHTHTHAHTQGEAQRQLAAGIVKRMFDLSRGAVGSKAQMRTDNEGLNGGLERAGTQEAECVCSVHCCCSALRAVCRGPG